ncbi:MAG: hypothetical protein DIU70_008855 [Bacillota bacterium]|nr:MAG: hypothetical protein DIU70_03290 [Bacillota bacterium]
MRLEIDSHRRWLPYLLIGLGLWWLVEVLWRPGPWFGAGALGLLAATLAGAYRWRERRWEYLTGAWLLGAWAAYILLDGYLPGGLPFAFFFAFLGLGFLGVYATGTRPAMWPLIPGAFLLGLATFLWVLTLGVQLAPYLLPFLLVAAGFWLLRRGAG